MSSATASATFKLPPDQASPTFEHISGDGADWLYGGVGNDTLWGGRDEGRLFGGDGNDRLYGYNNHDSLIGGAGNDYMSGGNGDDHCDGEDGNDGIEGAEGTDRIYSGEGGDTIVFREASHSAVGAARDVIHDFDTQYDTIQLYEMFDFMVSIPFWNGTSAAAYSVWILALGNNTLVRADTTGDAVADFELLLAGTTGVTEDNFII
ncbi:calcium-binding protein [Paracoccus lutimaris]|uniref:Hemolysin type calcium-binding protein n=1 Tax=Paracoccus lutimaris TaxID=1490030 RepID=A0A368YUE8_9RHOB|nr:calcium-binding protein [Paracoccus lutimaris]RCW83821.1 hemolysin type calcium-binding protein [Paracoccus lutimaris]